jgi:AcrR family transcriptional regulator
VGTVYQYFPHKQVLLYALSERYLDRVEDVCLRHHGNAFAIMVAALATDYWEAKTERTDVTRCSTVRPSGGIMKPT